MNRVITPTIEALTERIIGSAFTVSNELGHGFVESVYCNALAVELIRAGLRVSREKSFPVHYRDQKVGQFFADLVVEDLVIVELKAMDNMGEAQSAQLINYLKASNIQIGLLLNFGRPKLQIKRVIL